MPVPTAWPVVVCDVSVDELSEMVRQSDGAAYAILDACDEPRVPRKVRELGDERAVSLYRGAAERDYWSIAPYLVQVDEPLLDWIIENLWNDPWGIFAFAELDLESLRKHLRKSLTVEDPKGEKMYFRFYDPRVLGPFLRSCTEAEVDQFFGPMSQMVLSEQSAAPQSYRSRPAADSTAAARTR